MLAQSYFVILFGAGALGLAMSQKNKSIGPIANPIRAWPLIRALVVGRCAPVLCTDVPADAEGFKPAPVVVLASEAPARLVVDSPLPEPLARGYVVVQYRAENVRIMPVYGPAAQGVMPRIGHLHITVDDLPWHWLDASGEPLSINGLPPGPHTLLIELEDPVHQPIDSKVIKFEIPQRPPLPH